MQGEKGPSVLTGSVLGAICGCQSLAVRRGRDKQGLVAWPSEFLQVKPEDKPWDGDSAGHNEALTGEWVTWHCG